MIMLNNGKKKLSETKTMRWLIIIKASWMIMKMIIQNIIKLITFREESRNSAMRSIIITDVCEPINRYSPYYDTILEDDEENGTIFYQLNISCFNRTFQSDNYTSTIMVISSISDDIIMYYCYIDWCPSYIDEFADIQKCTEKNNIVWWSKKCSDVK